ncbi:MAG: hypothetical protein IT559_01285 [Alphaproteobacteria bacterium]|nr:hypothetical protein [Alphaproteobacteria bacterium]
MTSIPGSSQYVNAARLANLQNRPAQSTNLLDSLGAIGILEVGRRNAVKGVGISNNARALNADFLNKASSSANGLFSATVGISSTLDGLQKKVLALRSGLSIDRVAPSLRGDNVDETA